MREREELRSGGKEAQKSKEEGQEMSAINSIICNNTSSFPLSVAGCSVPGASVSSFSSSSATVVLPLN